MHALIGIAIHEGTKNVKLNTWKTSGKLLLILAVLGLMAGCGPSEHEIIHKYRPLEPGVKELNYVKVLESRGYKNISFHIPFPSLGNTYVVRMDCPFNLTAVNKDSVQRASKNIAIEMYRDIIEDSVNYYYHELQVEFSVEHSEIEHYHNVLVKEYDKDSLERWAGFEVIETRNGVFERYSVRCR